MLVLTGFPFLIKYALPLLSIPRELYSQHEHHTQISEHCPRKAHFLGISSGSESSKSQKGSYTLAFSLASTHMRRIFQMALERILEAKREKLENDKIGARAGDKTTLFRYIVNSDMPESERSDNRLASEAQVLLGAGTVTSARTLCFISYYILMNSSIRTRLAKELQEPMFRYPEVVPTWAELERVPILQALIKEGLR